MGCGSSTPSKRSRWAQAARSVTRYPYCKQDRIFILNGDTMAQVPFANVLRQHRADITICGKWMEDTGRYGVLDIDRENRVIAFREKRSNRSGYINAGIYLVDRNVIPCDRDRFSFEKDFLEPRHVAIEPANGSAGR